MIHGEHVQNLIEKHEELVYASRRMLRALDGARSHPRWDSDYAWADWHWAWERVYRKYRKQVEDLIA